MSVIASLLHGKSATLSNPRQGLGAAVQWLARAQDATGCGGVSAYYDAAKGQWAGAYPETTGYIIPTLLHYARLVGDNACRERALSMAAWESDIQLADGGVRAGTLDAARIVPTIFNTGQVLFGWLAAWQTTHHQRFSDSLVRAADWLVAGQDADGAWRRFSSPFATHTLNTYNTRVAFALALTGRALDEPGYTQAATRNVQWALTQMHPNGWLDHNDLQNNAQPLMHTIAYATRGILEVGLITDNADFVAAATRIARAVAATQRGDGALPGRLDADWQPAARWSCLTGNVQMAIVWQRLADAAHERSFRYAANRAIAFTVAAQDLTAEHPGLRGGIAGSSPRNGGYMKHRYPNWAAKFFIDALLLQQEGR
jgi:uncharacterized protein YyaL (SSP411 family)